ncbi:MAG: DNA adenine methylase [Bacteroidales bacterium]|nr:DNA adenine methylase [Bacteroidales bacterium]
MVTKSPLRYPGGKASLAGFLRGLIATNVEAGTCTYFELYAGGAGAALDLLMGGDVRRIVLNDADTHIFHFWDSILHHTDDFLRLLADTPVNMDEWHRQRAIYEGNEDGNNFHSPLEVGFATFFLNRTNRSGIIKKAGPIGGADQSGKYKMDCRFNKADLARRIERIASKADYIEMHNEDTLAFIAYNQQRLSDAHSFMYLDPPYYMNGSSLYLNAYGHQDHANLRDLMAGIRNLKWMISYDDVPEIHDLYDGFRTDQHELSYFLQEKRKTKEFFIFSDALIIG